MNAGRYAGTIEMDTFRITLTTDEFSALNEKFPSSRGSGDIGKRAVEIIRCHFKNQNPGCSFVETPNGADLVVLPVGATMPMVFEIKGTADPDIARQQLKVSSKSSHALLTSGLASVLRVIDVFGREPVVHELRHGKASWLEPEAGWTFKRTPGA